MKKLSIYLLFIFLSTSIFAQKGKSSKAATNYSDRINATLTAENNDLALSNSQKAQIISLFGQRAQEMKALKDSGNSEDKGARREIAKKYNGKINEILTEEQLAVYKKASKNKANGKKKKNDR